MTPKPTPRKTPTTVRDLTQKQQIGDLITHLGKADPHLHQALNSLQGQSNQMVENIQDLVLAINNLTQTVAAAIAKATSTPVTIIPPAVPGGGGLRGHPSMTGGSGGNTKPIPPPVKRS